MPQECQLHQECTLTLWEQGVAHLKREFSLLPAARRTALAELLAEAGRLKEEIVALTDTADGVAICAACQGACCRVGKYHPVPFDILAAVFAGEEPVTPDFAAYGCPFLGSCGCRMIPSRRPVTCVAFICDLIAEGLPPAELARLYRLEEELHRVRAEIANRFGRRLIESFMLEMERMDGESVPFLTVTTAGGGVDGDRN